MKIKVSWSVTIWDQEDPDKGGSGMGRTPEEALQSLRDRLGDEQRSIKELVELADKL